ncbi:hypothetical protein ACN47E_003933 [Coniothyrium glycines]
MPSHLTRIVFRRIIANEPILSHGNRCRAVSPRFSTRNGFQLSPQSQRRTFFSLFKQERKLKDFQMPAGLEKMGMLSKALQYSHRPPKSKDIAAAFLAFFAQRKGTFEEFHLRHAHRSLKYLLENPRDDGEPWFTKKELENVIVKLLDTARLPDTAGQLHIAFGRTILDVLEGKVKAKEDKDTAQDPSDIYDDAKVSSLLIRLLSRCGAPVEARDIVTDKFVYDAQADVVQRRFTLSQWSTVLKGIARENNAEIMSETCEILKTHGIPLTRSMQKVLVTFYGEQKDLDKAKYWYTQPVVNSTGDPATDPSGSTSSALLRACALCGDLTYGHEVVADLLKDDMPEKTSWDAVFLWSAAIGKGVDEVDRMMNVLVRRNDEARQKDPTIALIRPDIDTINALVEFSMSKQDHYSAERYIHLGEKRGIVPDEKTYSLQMQYRISVGDLDGARAAYFNLQGNFTGAEDSVAAINRLIQALCASKQQHFDELMAMVDDLQEHKAIFAPETIAALTILHLRRGETHDAMDLLLVHSYQSSLEQRKVIRDALSAFILDPKSSTSDAWDGYQILRTLFVEATRDERLPLMEGFFRRERPDMACHVFFHMRKNLSDPHSANRDVYVAAFTGYARCADAESLELTHNQLRLDMNVDMDTRLRNSLMLAYAAVADNRKAMHFWREICESKEGPTYNSIAIVFRACEGTHGGAQNARTIWKRLVEQDVEIDKSIWLAYMCAIASNSSHDEAQALIENVEEEYGFTPDLQILGNWFNMTEDSERQEEVEAWIKQRYPKVWEEFSALEMWVTMDGFGYRQYDLNRDLEP